MKRWRAYTPEENELIRREFPKLGSTMTLPGRSVKAISDRARRMGIPFPPAIRKLRNEQRSAMLKNNIMTAMERRRFVPQGLRNVEQFSRRWFVLQDKSFRKAFQESGEAWPT